MIDEPTVRVCPHAAAVAQALVELLIESAAAAVEARDSFHVCLAGGSTPRAAYSLLAARAERVIAWEKMHVYFGTDRCAPSPALKTLVASLGTETRRYVKPLTRIERRSSAPSPSSSSMRSRRLHLATRSLREALPVLIWPALVATAALGRDRFSRVG
jgi:hypothetical protein